MRKVSLIRSTAKAQTSLRSSAVGSVTQPAVLIMYGPKGMPQGTGFAQCSTTIVSRRIAYIAAKQFLPYWLKETTMAIKILQSLGIYLQEILRILCCH